MTKTMRYQEGPFYEDLVPGTRMHHGGRTITEADNIWFSLLTCNANPIHFDNTYAKETEFGRPIINSTLTLAIATGLSVKDISRIAINLSWSEIKMLHPLFPGDTLQGHTEVLERRSSRSRPGMGIVTVRTTGSNQDDESIIEFERTILIPKRPSKNGKTEGR